jgi:hypothetical protein
MYSSSRIILPDRVSGDRYRILTDAAVGAALNLHSSQNRDTEALLWMDEQGQMERSHQII